MDTEPTTESPAGRDAELESLRARVAALEEELLERTERANAAVAAAQDRAYWLDRWRIDLNALMRRRGASGVRAALRILRLVYRKGREVRRELPAEATREQAAAGLGAQDGRPGGGFGRALAPDRLSSSEVTDLLLAKLDGGVSEEVESRLDDADRTLLAAAGPVDRKRLTLHFGVHYGVDGVLRGTGLTSAAPPAEVHSMARGSAAAGGSLYYADLVVDALRQGGLDPAAARRGLDFGCSSGRVVRVLAAAYPSVEWHGCDPIAPAIEWASENIEHVRFAVSPQRPPLPYGAEDFDLAFAVSVWSHFAEAAALAWLEEMRRIVRPGGVLVLSTHGFQSIAHDGERGLRSAAQLAELESTLYERGFWFRNEFGESGDHGITDPDWGTAFMTPEWLLARVTPRWRLAGFAPGRLEDNQDLYVLERR